MRLRWYTVVVDSLDPRAQARWWAAVLEGVVVDESDEGGLVIPGDMPPELLADGPVPAERWHRFPPGLAFVRVDGAKQVKNRLHLDLAPHAEDDRDAQIERLLAHGARRVDVGQDESVVDWTVLADPEGNEFCLLSSRLD